MIEAAKGGRVVVIGLDGTPFSFLKKEIEAGTLPNLAGLESRGQFVQMESEIPAISSVAWASFMTGRNPGEHGIFGFTDRKPDTYELYFPNYSHLKAEPLWETLSRAGKRCCVLNVPSTYPARPLNGVLVSGFVAPSLERATYPSEAFEYLSNMGYRIDVDAAKARESLDLLLEDLHATLEKRREAFLHFLESEKWDLFVAVFTGTDRLHHFMWKHYERGDPVYRPEFLRFYRRLDEIIGELVATIPDDAALFMLSDHGFCSLHRQVYLNYLLKEEGLLTLATDEPRTIADIDPGRTQAYCMDPGRIYVNLKGREPAGIVASGAEYDALIERLLDLITSLSDSENDAPMVGEVKQGRELFSGSFIERAPDLVVVPRNGYDFKGALGSATLTDVGIFTGMHTHDDAFLFLSAVDPGPAPHIRDVASYILSFMQR